LNTQNEKSEEEKFHDKFAANVLQLGEVADLEALTFN
jgi:hypothetical protein